MIRDQESATPDLSSPKRSHTPLRRPSQTLNGRTDTALGNPPVRIREAVISRIPRSINPVAAGERRRDLIKVHHGYYQFWHERSVGSQSMSAQTSTAGLLTLTTVANRLHYLGRDRERSVRRLFAQHGVSMIRRGRRGYFVTEWQYAALIEKMTTCLPSGAEARTTTSAVPCRAGNAHRQRALLRNGSPR